jgi:ABC-2 type transport system ATP-binding protein
VRFGSVLAVDNIDLALGAGVVGLLGPNGAGKTTLLSVLAGAIRPTTGEVRVAGHDVGTVSGRRAFRGSVGYLPQRFDLAGNMTVADSVRYAAWCNGVASSRVNQAADGALALVELSERAKFRVRRLSGGQRQRLGLAAALAHGPQILLLDEPTVGLDPDQRIRFRGYLRAVGQTTSVLLATHLLEDVKQAASNWSSCRPEKSLSVALPWTWSHKENNSRWTTRARPPWSADTDRSFR